MLKKAQTKYSISKPSNLITSQEKSISKSQNHSETSKFNKFDIVWAKITGYPWWPAIITTVPGEIDSSHKEEDSKNKYPWAKVTYNSKVQYRVDFIADETHAFLKKNFLLKYIENRDKLYVEGLQFSSRKRRYFQMAINEADQLQQVLQISKAEAGQCIISDKDKDNCLKQSDNIKSEAKDNSGSEFQQQQSEKQSEIKITKCLPITKRSGRYLVKKQKSQHLLSVQNTIQNQRNDFSFLKDTEKKQVNNVIVAPSIEKRKGRLLRIVKPSSNCLSIDERKNKINTANSTKIQEEIKQTNQQNQPQYQHEIYQENERSNEMKLIKIAKNEFEEENTFADKKQLRSSSGKNFMQLQSTQVLMKNLLKKYKLDNLNEVQNEFKRQNTTSNRIQTIYSLQNTSSMPMKGSKSMMFIKNVFSQLSKRKNAKKTNGDKYYHSQSNVFAENLTVISKIKESEHEKISAQRKQNLVQYSKKYTTRKTYSIVLEILKKNCVQLSNQQVLTQIKDRCKKISDLIFDQEELKKTTIQRKSNPFSNKKKENSEQSTNFFTCFKRKLEESVKFLRLFSLENWQLLTKVATFSTQLCIQIKSFEQFLQKQCHIIMRNEQKFEDIVKQIGIENQKTDFAYGPLANYMQAENDSANLSPRKYLDQKNQCQSKLINTENLIIQSK